MDFGSSYQKLQKQQQRKMLEEIRKKQMEERMKKQMQTVKQQHAKARQKATLKIK